ncbi:hypothetical protein PVAP13_7KG275755, partial [Panicum virgatum]
GVAALVIGSQCAIHYVEGKTRRRERTRTYGLWAWCVNPSNIAKEGWHTVTDPDREMDGRRQEVEVHYEEPSGFKFGITYKLFIHLDVVEDLSFIQGPGGDPNRKTRRVFDWQYGVPDSLGERRERPRGRQEDRGTTPRRRDDDDNDDYHRGTRRHRSSHAWERVSRCRGAVEDCYSTSRHDIPPRRPGSWRCSARQRDCKSSRVQHISTETPTAQRKSTRLADKAKLNPVKGSLNLAQRVLINKLGELSPNLKQKANVDFNYVVRHFQQPVTKKMMDALTVLVEQGNK